MPQLGETVTEGTITRWMKQVGDTIAEDEVLFEVSTDKVDSEVPSPVAGVVTEILVPEGDTVDVGTRLAVISDGAEATDGPAASKPTAADTAEPEPPDTTGSGRKSDPSESASESESDSESADSDAEPVVAEARLDPTDAEPVTDSDPRSAGAKSASGPPPKSDGAGPGPEPAGAARRATDGGDGGLVLSPVVRRLIAEHDLDPTQIEGTGAGGRITRSDVLALIDRRNGSGRGGDGTAGPPVRADAPVTPPRSAPVPPAQGSNDTIVPFTNIRRRTAEHMVRSKHTSAHAMVAFEVDYSGVDRVRLAEKDKFRAAEGFGLTYLPFITRAVVDALGDFPDVNSSVGDDSLIIHHDLNIGIAVDLDFEGLLVPVLHQADGKRLKALARDISSLAAKARSKRLTMDDISGGTFTITNAGPFGTFITVPVINQPQVAILSTDGVRKRPVAIELPDGSDGIAVHPVGNLVLSWDHRAFDGAYAAAFVGAIKKIIETRDWTSEL